MAGIKAKAINPTKEQKLKEKSIKLTSKMVKKISILFETKVKKTITDTRLSKKAVNIMSHRAKKVNVQVVIRIITNERKLFGICSGETK